MKQSFKKGACGCVFRTAGEDFPFTSDGLRRAVIRAELDASQEAATGFRFVSTSGIAVVCRGGRVPIIECEKGRTDSFATCYPVLLTDLPGAKPIAGLRHRRSRR